MKRVMCLYRVSTKGQVDNQDDILAEGEPGQATPFIQRFNEIYELSYNIQSRTLLQKLLTIYNSGVSRFTTEDYANMLGCSRKTAYDSCNRLCKKGLITSKREGRRYVYTFASDTPAEASAEKQHPIDLSAEPSLAPAPSDKHVSPGNSTEALSEIPPSVPEQYREKLSRLVVSTSAKDRRIAKCMIKLFEEGRATVTNSQW